MIESPLLKLDWLVHGFGESNSVYPEGFATVHQIHSDIVLNAGRCGGQLGQGDALVSNFAGLTVAVKTADCVPILLCDPKTRAVGAVHAGWRGTAENIVAKAVEKMASIYGANPSDIIAAIGPSIGPCCYEVSPEVARRFGKWVPEWEQFSTPGNIDLARVNRIQLEQAGVTSIWSAGVCTRCDRRFWSFRRQKENAGRMFSFIGVAK